MEPLTKFDSLLVKKGSLEPTFFFMMSGYIFSKNEGIHKPVTTKKR
jgi:hypothetical protein